MEHPSEGGAKFCINGPGHMTKMAAMAINSKNLYKSSLYKSSFSEPESLDMKHQAVELYKVCVNHDPGMTLTF